jgi:beta-galactosidase GanA
VNQNLLNLTTQLSPNIARHQGRSAMDGILLDKHVPAVFGSYKFIIKHDYTVGWSPGAKEEQGPESGRLVIQTAPDEFLVAATGIVVTFETVDKRDGRTGILNIKGEFENEQWIPARTMNGDQRHQDRHLRIPVDDYGIQKLILYKYKSRHQQRVQKAK